MISIEKMTVDHMNAVLSDQKMLKSYLSQDHVKGLVAYDNSYAAINEQGKVIAVAGVVERWENRSEVWAIIDENSRDNFLELHNAVKRFLSIYPIKRVEAVVEYTFEAGHRWMRLLGFKKETERMIAYGPGGNDSTMYVKIKEDK